MFRLANYFDEEPHCSVRWQQTKTLTKSYFSEWFSVYMFSKWNMSKTKNWQIFLFLISVQSQNDINTVLLVHVFMLGPTGWNSLFEWLESLSVSIHGWKLNHEISLTCCSKFTIIPFRTMFYFNMIAWNALWKCLIVARNTPVS